MIRCVSHVIASVRGTCFAGHILSFVLGSHTGVYVHVRAAMLNAYSVYM